MMRVLAGMVAGLAVAGLAGTDAKAQDDLVFSPERTEACLAASASDAEKRTCFGASATACMEASPAGGTTMGTGVCLSREYDWWDARLNAVYRELRSRERGVDQETRELGSHEASRAEALLAAQRAWIPYRDATCEYERTQWGNGTGGGPAQVDCLMRLTAEQVLFLEGMLGTW